MALHSSLGSASKGFTYVFFLWFILIYGILIGSYIEITSTQTHRQKEAEFFRVGLSYQRAIEGYFMDRQIFPLSPNLLLCNGANYPCKRYLRQLYLDPLNNQPFDFIYSPQHEIIGVKSKYQAKIIDQTKVYDYGAHHYNQVNFQACMGESGVYCARGNRS